MGKGFAKHTPFQDMSRKEIPVTPYKNSSLHCSRRGQPRSLCVCVCVSVYPDLSNIPGTNATIRPTHRIQTTQLSQG
jgi:hypothetical protein